jgi:ABC-type sugar transport system substrate-binding protein
MNRSWKRARSVLATVTAIAMIGSLMSTSTGVRAARSSDPTSVYFIFTGFAYPYFAPMAQGVKAVAKKWPSLSIKIVSANNSAPTEITDINEAVAAGAKGIVLNPVEESVTSAAHAAMAKGIPVVTLDRDVSNPADRIAFIGDNDVTLGREQTQYALKVLKRRHVKKPWHIVILQGTLGASTAIDRAKGAMAVLRPYMNRGAVKVVLNQSANFATNTAESMISTELGKTTDIQAIICGNDAMALGAITALKDHGMKPGQKVLVVGADAQPESLAAVRQGTQLDTVTHSPFSEAVWAVDALANVLNFHTKPPARYPHGNLIIPMTLVTKANVNKISAWGTPPIIPRLPYGRSQPVPR